MADFSHFALLVLIKSECVEEDELEGGVVVASSDRPFFNVFSSVFFNFIIFSSWHAEQNMNLGIR